MKKEDKVYSLFLVLTFILLFFNISSSTKLVSAARSDSYFEYAYVPNEKTEDVSVINTTTNTVISTLPVGKNPVGVAVNHDGTRLYVTNSGNDIDRGFTYSIINTDTDEVTSKLVYAGEGVKPFGIAITPDETLYIASYVTGKVYAINQTADYSTPISVGIHPIGVAITPDGKWVYVANRGSNTVSVINTTTNSVVGEPIAVGSEPYGVAVGSDGKVYVTNQNSSSVSVINTSTNNVTTIVSVGIYPHGVAVTPDGKKVYVANHNPYHGTVSVINTTTNDTKEIRVNGIPCGVAVTHDGKWAYVTTSIDNNSGRVLVINTTTDTVIPSNLVVGILPSGLGQYIGRFRESRVETTIALASSIKQDILHYLIGEKTILTAKVGVSSRGTEKPSGKVIFMEGFTPIEGGTRDVDVDSGQATFDTSSLSISSHKIRAKYTGDTNFRPSTSSSQLINNEQDTFWKPIISSIIVTIILGILSFFAREVYKRKEVNKRK